MRSKLSPLLGLVRYCVVGFSGDLGYQRIVPNELGGIDTIIFWPLVAVV